MHTYTHSYPQLPATLRIADALQVRQFLVAVAAAGAAQRTEAPAAAGVDDRAGAVQEWVIIKNDVGRCGDGIQVRKPVACRAMPEMRADRFSK